MPSGHRSLSEFLRMLRNHSADPRYLGAYEIAEAARYLAIPATVLRVWTGGKVKSTNGAGRPKRSLILPPKQRNRRRTRCTSLSFVNLVEAHVLDAARRSLRDPLPRIQSALNALRKRFESKHPLAEQ